MDVVALYASLAGIMVGLGSALFLILGRRDPAGGVVRSLYLIEQTVQPREVAKNAVPASRRLGMWAHGTSQALAERLSPQGAGARLARLLDIAGNPPRWSVERLLAAKGAGLLVVALLGLLLGGGFTVAGILGAAGGAVLGFFLPDLLAYNAGQKRQQQLARSLADALDMLTVCVEAGQGFDASLMQVARSVSGPIAGEFSRVLQEIQIGKARGEAFSALAARTTVPEVKTFVTALVQADRLGLPIGAVLREQAVSMRLVRRQRAEEQAQKVTVKILFPLIFCIFPVLMIVVIGPGIIRLMHAFSGM